MSLLLLCACPAQVDPTDASSSAQQVPNRLALLMCQAMLLRGDDAQHKLQAAVGYLATCRMSDSLQLPVMLAGCMEALFTSDDWDRCVVGGVCRLGCRGGWYHGLPAAAPGSNTVQQRATLEAGIARWICMRLD